MVIVTFYLQIQNWEINLEFALFLNSEFTVLSFPSEFWVNVSQFCFLFPPRNKKIKRYSNFCSQNCDLSQFSVYILQFWWKKSQIVRKNSGLQEKGSEVWVAVTFLGFHKMQRRRRKKDDCCYLNILGNVVVFVCVWVLWVVEQAVSCALDAKVKKNFNISENQIGSEYSVYSKNATQLLYYFILKTKDFRD